MIENMLSRSRRKRVAIPLLYQKAASRLSAMRPCLLCALDSVIPAVVGQSQKLPFVQSDLATSDFGWEADGHVWSGWAAIAPVAAVPTEPPRGPLQWISGV